MLHTHANRHVSGGGKVVLFFFENNCRESRGDRRGCRRKDTAVVCLTGSVLRRSLNAALPPHIYKQPENLKHYLTFHTPYLSNYGFFFSLKTHARQSPTPDACMCTNATQSTGNNMNDEPFLGHCSHSKAWSALWFIKNEMGKDLFPRDPQLAVLTAFAALTDF